MSGAGYILLPDKCILQPNALRYTYIRENKRYQRHQSETAVT